MREILFRGKRVDNGEWVEGFYCHFENFLSRDVIYSDGNLWAEVLPATVGQKWIVSGKEFFGGDLFTAICSISGSNKKAVRICKVIDSPQGFDVAIWYKDEWWAYSSMDYTTAKVIGNIYDNQELIQK